jgi:hypothetical protein
MMFNASYDHGHEPGQLTTAVRCILLTGWVTLSSTGCNSQVSSDNGAADTSRIKALTMLYTSYMNRHGGAPASESEFKRYITETGKPFLESQGIAVDELFVSPRDNQPHVVLYGTEAAKLLNQGVVTYERTGVDGTRLVGYRAGSVNEVDEIEFRKLIPSS